MARRRVPSYRLHRPSGQAVVTLCGKDLYLGPYNTQASRREYDRCVAEWMANDRQLPDADAEGPTVTEICVAFLEWAPTVSVQPEGQPSKEVGNYRLALTPLRRLYGRTLAKDFGPLALQAVQAAMVDLGWARNTINRQIGRVKAVFKWAVSRQLLSPSVLVALQSVSGLRRGRSGARETDPVCPVPQRSVDAVLPFLPAPVRALVQLQLLTGTRPGELMRLRPVDIDTAGPIWMTTASDHKNAWRNQSRTIFFGPRAQEVLRPFLNRPLAACLFSPAEAAQEMRDQRLAARITPMNQGNRPGTNRVKTPERTAGAYYTTASYRRAIARACDRAFPPPGDLARQKDETIEQWRSRLEKAGKLPELEAWQRDHRWHPHQLRHSAATNARKEFGPDAARALLGQRSLVATQIYAEIDAETVQAIVSKIG